MPARVPELQFAQPVSAFLEGQNNALNRQSTMQQMEHRNALMARDEKRFQMDEQKFQSDQRLIGQKILASVAMRAEIARRKGGDPAAAGEWDKSVDQLVNNGFQHLAQYKGQYSPDGLQGLILAAMDPDKAAGVLWPELSATEAPSNVREYEYFKNLPPEGKQAFLEMKRSQGNIGYIKMVGPNGQEQIVATDPRNVGAQVVGSGETYGTGVAPRGPMAPQGAPQSPQQTPAPQGTQPPHGVPQVLADYDALANEFGANITSLYRSPERNAIKNGVPNSRHLDGRGGDFQVPPQNRAAFKAKAERMGYKAIDEGNHIHLEPRGGGNPFAGQGKADETREVEQAKVDVQLQNAPRIGDAEAEAERKKTEAKATGERNAAEAKKAGLAKQREELYTLADKYLPESTGSGVGTAVDFAGSLVGKSFDGAEAGDQLKIIAGTLTSMVPRMEGPQSNFDVQQYRQMAGDLGNTMLPRARRLAALKTLRALDEKYKHLNQDAPAGGAGAAPEGVDPAVWQHMTPEERALWP